MVRLEGRPSNDTPQWKIYRSPVSFTSQKPPEDKKGAWSPTPHLTLSCMRCRKMWLKSNPYSKMHWSINVLVVFFFFFLLATSRMACADPTSLIKDWPVPPAFEAWSPNHWTTSEVPKGLILRQNRLYPVGEQGPWAVSPSHQPPRIWEISSIQCCGSYCPDMSG